MRQSVLGRKLVFRSASLFVALVTISQAAFAQQPTNKRPPKTPPTQAAPSSPPTTTPITVPPPPTVNDPMLAPVPAAAKNVGSWEEALTLVRARSTDLRTALDQVESAEAQSRIALSNSLPTVNGSGSATYNILTKDSSSTISTGTGTGTGAGTTTTISSTSPPRGPYVQGSITGAVPIFSPRNWYSVGTAHRAEDVARFSVEDTKRTIALNIASSLIAVVTAERVAELNRIGFRSALERLELTTRQKALGAATGLDVVRVQQDVESARATLVTGDESLRQAREALGLALGVPDAMGVEPSISLDGVEKGAGTSCKPAGKVEDRADIAAARKRVEQAERGITDANYGYSPTISLESTLAATSLDTSSANPTWNIQALLSVPFYDGGTRDGQRRQAYAATDQADQARISAERNAQIQVAQARRGVQVASDSRQVAANARQLAAEVDRLTRAQYIEGEGTSLELVTAASALRQAEVNLALQDNALVRARVTSLLVLANCPF
ncbi:MAG TPA: TolC family protein [Polyangiaceae bacterium]|nr:TolC family protein [Polyangiaceae bacterium]